MQTILEEVLWVATLPQLRSAILFGKHILDLIDKSQEAAQKQKEPANPVLKSIVSKQLQRVRATAPPKANPREQQEVESSFLKERCWWKDIVPVYRGMT